MIRAACILIAISSVIIGAWPAAIFFGLMAMVFKSEKKLNIEGKPASGGILGHMYDRSLEKTCPACKSTIHKASIRCKHCKEPQA